MSKTISDELKDHLAGTLTTVAMCWRVTRLDGEVFRFTSHDVDVVIDDETYESASGAVGTALEQKLDFSVDNMEITGFLQSTKVKETEIAAGLFDYAKVDIFVVNWTDYESDDVVEQVT